MTAFAGTSGRVLAQALPPGIGGEHGRGWRHAVPRSDRRRIVEPPGQRHGVLRFRGTAPGIAREPPVADGYGTDPRRTRHVPSERPSERFRRARARAERRHGVPGVRPSRRRSSSPVRASGSTSSRHPARTRTRSGSWRSRPPTGRRSQASEASRWSDAVGAAPTTDPPRFGGPADAAGRRTPARPVGVPGDGHRPGRRLLPHRSAYRSRRAACGGRPYPAAPVDRPPVPVEPVRQARDRHVHGPSPPAPRAYSVPRCAPAFPSSSSSPPW